MSLNCFFGIEVKPDGVPVIPVIPQGSSLVLTHCSVTSAFPPQQQQQQQQQQASHNNKNGDEEENGAKKADRAAGAKDATVKPLATTYSPVTLYVQGYELPTRFAVCTLAPHQRLPFCPLQLIFTKQASFTLVGHEPDAARAARERPAYPTVHLTGYYESDEQEEEEDEDDEGEEDEEDDDEDEASLDEEQIIRHRPAAQKQKNSNNKSNKKKASKKAQGKSEKKNNNKG